MNRATTVSECVEKINDYLGNGGLFNPEMMDHDKVRDLLLECRDALLKESESHYETAEIMRRIRDHRDRLKRQLDWALGD